MSSHVRIVLGIGVVLTLLAVSALVLKVPKEDSCVGKPSPEECVLRTAKHMAMSGDIRGALNYASGTLQVYKRGTMHMAMHMIGQAAYNFTGSRLKAMEYLPKDSLSDTQWITYEGYQHGVLEAYFSDRIGEEHIDLLIKESCSSYYEATELTSDSVWRGHRQCFHAVGHGLLFAYTFDIERAIEVCRRLPHQWMVDTCAYGAYMGLSYLYSPQYMPEASRADVSGESMAQFCKTQQELSSLCATFVGRSYFASHGKDVSGAFTECTTLNPRDASICHTDTAEYVVTLLGTDFSRFSTSCRDVPGGERACLFAIARAIAHGYAGEDARKEDFCAYLQEDMKADCRTYVNT